MPLAVDIVSYVLAAIYLAAGATHLARLKGMRAIFQKFGYPIWLMVPIGACEVSGAVLLLFPNLGVIGASGFALLMAGACFSHLRIGEVKECAPPIVLMALNIYVAVMRAPAFLTFEIG